MKHAVYLLGLQSEREKVVKIAKYFDGIILFGNELFLKVNKNYSKLCGKGKSGLYKRGFNESEN